MRTLLVHPVALTTAVALTLVVAGCVPAATPADPAPNPTQPSTEPHFASEEEALAAAEEAYAAYREMQQEIAADQWRDASRIAPFVTEQYLEQALKTAKEIVESGARLTGATRITSFELQQYSPPVLVAYVCHDVSEVRVLDKAGRDVTPPTRAASNLLEISFELEGATFLVAGSDLWSENC